jgi:MFS family permease
MRFLAGVGGSACITIGTGVIADLFVASQRGKAVAIYSMGILFGPILGPICGGFIAQRAGWRWDMWVVLIVAVLLTAGLFVWNNVMNKDKPAAALTPKAILLNGITRPLKMLFTQPIVLLCSLYMSFLFGLLFLLFTTLTPVFLQTYGKHTTPKTHLTRPTRY